MQVGVIRDEDCGARYWVLLPSLAAREEQRNWCSPLTAMTPKTSERYRIRVGRQDLCHNYAVPRNGDRMSLLYLSVV